MKNKNIDPQYYNLAKRLERSSYSKPEQIKVNAELAYRTALMRFSKGDCPSYTSITLVFLRWVWGKEE